MASFSCYYVPSINHLSSSLLSDHSLFASCLSVCLCVSVLWCASLKIYFFCRCWGIWVLIINFWICRYIPQFFDACVGVLKEGADRDPELLEQAWDLQLYFVYWFWCKALMICIQVDCISYVVWVVQVLYYEAKQYFPMHTIWNIPSSWFSRVSGNGGWPVGAADFYIGFICHQVSDQTPHQRHFFHP